MELRGSEGGGVGVELPEGVVWCVDMSLVLVVPSLKFMFGVGLRQTHEARWNLVHCLQVVVCDSGFEKLVPIYFRLSFSIVSVTAGHGSNLISTIWGPQNVGRLHHGRQVSLGVRQHQNQCTLALSVQLV